MVEKLSVKTLLKQRQILDALFYPRKILLFVIEGNGHLRYGGSDSCFPRKTVALTPELTPFYRVSRFLG